MPKFAINNKFNSDIDPSVTKAVIKSTPVTHAFAEKIMSFWTPDSKDPLLTDEDQAIQALFDKWPVDTHTERLASLVSVLTGFKPKVTPATLPIGSLFKSYNVIYAVFYTPAIGTVGNVYGINRAANAYCPVSCLTSNSPSSAYAVTAAEAGQFAKDLLAVKGSQLMGYVASTAAGAGALGVFLTAIGVDDSVI